MIHLDIVTPTRKLVSAECETVNIPGYKGELGILPEHTTLVTSLDTGVVKYASQQQTQTVAVKGGFAQVSKDKVMLLVDDGIRAQDIEAEDLKKQSTILDQKLVAAEIGPQEREKLFEDRLWLNACLEMKK